MKQIRMFGNMNSYNVEEAVNNFLKELSNQNISDIDIKFSTCEKNQNGKSDICKSVLVIYETDNA